MRDTLAIARYAAVRPLAVCAAWIVGGLLLLGTGARAEEPILPQAGLLVASRTVQPPRTAPVPQPSEAANGPLLVADRRGLHDEVPSEAWFEALTDPQRRQAGFELPPCEWPALNLTEAPLAVVPVRLPAEDFSELDAGRPRLAVTSLVADEQRSIVGGRVLLSDATDKRRITAEARMNWLCEFLQNPAAATSFFAPGDKAVYAVQGLSYGNNWILLGCAWRWELTGGLSAFAGYDTQVNAQEMFHIGSTGLAVGW